jgi:hypothetical protein
LQFFLFFGIALWFLKVFTDIFLNGAKFWHTWTFVLNSTLSGIGYINGWYLWFYAYLFTPVTCDRLLIIIEEILGRLLFFDVGFDFLDTDIFGVVLAFMEIMVSMLITVWIWEIIGEV